MITHITSTENKIYKLVRKLERKSTRQKQGLFIAEGARLVEDAIKANCVSFLITTSQLNSNLTQYILSEKLYKGISQTKSPQGVLAVCKLPEYSEDLLLENGPNFILICDRVSDPGNLGTIIRTAEAAGVDFILLTENTVDPYNPKTVRSTMGSIFRMPIVKSDDLIDELIKKGFTIAVTTLDCAKDLYECNLKGRIAVVIGNEAMGVKEDIYKKAKLKIKIPMSGKVESLNAAIATSVILYECKRQRGNL